MFQCQFPVELNACCLCPQGTSMCQAIAACVVILMLFTSRAIYNFISIYPALKTKVPDFGYDWVNVSDQVSIYFWYRLRLHSKPGHVLVRPKINNLCFRLLPWDRYGLFFAQVPWQLLLLFYVYWLFYNFKYDCEVLSDYLAKSCLWSFGKYFHIGKQNNCKNDALT